jgi:methyl-accepting chemotaxis protein
LNALKILERNGIMRHKKNKNSIMNILCRCKSLMTKLLLFLKSLKSNNPFHSEETTHKRSLKIGKVISRLTNFKSLKTKLLIFNSVTISLVIIIIMIYMINVSVTNAKKEMENNLKSQSTAAEIILNNQINNIKNININIAKSSAFSMLIQMDLKEQLSESIKEYMAKYPEIDGVIVYKGDTEIYSTTQNSELKISNTLKEKSGFIQGEHINIFSNEDITDSNAKTIGTIILLHDITTENKLIKEISSALNTNTFLFEGNKLAAMSDLNGKAYSNDKNKDTIIDLESVAKGKRFSNTTTNIFDKNYYLYCNEIKDYLGKPIGALSVGVTDSSLKGLVRNISFNMIAIGLVLLALGLLFAWIISIIITSPIKQLVKSVELVQKGDLTVTTDYKGRDEIGLLSNAFSEMVSTLRTILTSINNKSILLSDLLEGINDSCTESVKTFENISSATQDIAKGAVEQVKSIDTAKNQMEEILNDMARMTDLLSEATKISSNAGESASLGNNLVTEALDQMDNINDSILDSNKCLKELGYESDNIFKIVKVISEIASQTQLLALNATIEASKAGESGRGFSVIASEIRKLALRSKNSTAEINKIISDIKEHINKTIQIADSGIIQAEKGVSVVSNARNTFDMINNNTKDIMEKVNAVVVATERIVSDSKIFTKSFYQTGEVAENTSASIQEIAATLEDQTDTMGKIANSSGVLSQSSKEMHALVAKFKIN